MLGLICFSMDANVFKDNVVSSCTVRRAGDGDGDGDGTSLHFTSSRYKRKAFGTLVHH